jgi:hypothetical protein
MKRPIFVMPAWIAGIQFRKDASGNIHVNLIPALHAGITQLKGFCINDRGSPPIFSKEVTRMEKIFVELFVMSVS